ncbi:hypothetical protein VNO78_16564 [Psophocarpus tetragonolobus]|uniref:Uncharacterized protein n=1 Tax=Psophocarpus tetragonolobus TaxID=3891 RepID=A0AAN9XKR3_PSOTE
MHACVMRPCRVEPSKRWCAIAKAERMRGMDMALGVELIHAPLSQDYDRNSTSSVLRFLVLLLHAAAVQSENDKHKVQRDI